MELLRRVRAVLGFDSCLDAAAAAAYLKVSPENFEDIVRAGDIPRSRVREKVCFRVSDLNAYLKERQSWVRDDRTESGL